MDKELKEAKKKVIDEYKSSKNFLDDIVEGSLSAFHEGFKDHKNKIKEIFPNTNVSLLILSINWLVEEEEARGV